MIAKRPTEDARPLSRAVLDAVAAAEDVEPVELSQPLYGVINPEALDALFRTGEEEIQTRGKVMFDYHGYEVTAHSDGTVELRRADDDRPRSTSE